MKSKKKVFELTSEQKTIVAEEGNCVVIATPGSGKTTVISRKISCILPNLFDYQGVIAISFTNKASDQLKKYLDPSVNKKQSFFGTIDKFLLSEIVIPFGKHKFGIPIKDFTIIELEQIPPEYSIDLNWLDSEFHHNDLETVHIEILKEFFIQGIIIIKTIGILANYIFDNSVSCKKYLKARYTHIFIDEYQDSDFEQNAIFLKLEGLGLCAFSVGDVNQSIFGFAGKSSEYLLCLANDNEKFKVLPLSQNHRNHLSIVNYSMRLLSPTCKINKTDEIRVYEEVINGSEYDIAKWLNSAINDYFQNFGVLKKNEVAVLVKNKRTGDIIDETMNLNHKYLISTALDNDSSNWSIIFRRILYYLFDNDDNKTDILENFFGINNSQQRKKATIIFDYLGDLENEIDMTPLNIDGITELFIKIANIINPDHKNKRSISLLHEVLNSDKLLDSFKPADDDEIQLMTLHKSKGMEFDIVFHLDLYEWILPSAKPSFRNKIYNNYEQDLNLHYVGITRARKCCVLCTSTKRHNFKGEEKNGIPSEFLKMNNLSSLRIRRNF